MCQTLVGVRDTAVTEKVFLGELYMLWAQGPSKLNSTTIGFPITSLTSLKREAITCEFLPCARPCAFAISFNHQNSMRWYHFRFPDKGWRHWEVKERARITQLESSKAKFEMQTFQPPKLTTLPSHQTAWKHAVAPPTRVQTNPVFLADKITTRRQVPMDKNSCSPQVLFCVIKSSKRKFGF